MILDIAGLDSAIIYGLIGIICCGIIAAMLKNRIDGE